MPCSYISSKNKKCEERCAWSSKYCRLHSIHEKEEEQDASVTLSTDSSNSDAEIDIEEVPVVKKKTKQSKPSKVPTGPTNPGPNSYMKNLLREVDTIKNEGESTPVKSKKKPLKVKVIDDDVEDKEETPNNVDETTQPETPAKLSVADHLLRNGALMGILLIEKLLDGVAGIQLQGLTAAINIQPQFMDLVNTILEENASNAVSIFREHPSLQLCAMIGQSMMTVHHTNCKILEMQKAHTPTPTQHTPATPTN